MPHAPVEIRSLARQWTSLAINTLADIAGDNDEDASPRVAAAIALLDRGWGKPAQTHTGEDGEGDIRIVVRHIISSVRAEQPLKLVEQSNGRELVGANASQPLPSSDPSDDERGG
jgi:hypothetical protein